MARKCKPTIESVTQRMKAAERFNNRRGGTFHYRSGFTYPIEIFGITNSTKTGAFTIEDIINELKQ